VEGGVFALLGVDMERKTYSAFETKIADGAQGIVETIFAVMGNLDDGDDVLHPGAFAKTLIERGHKVKVLDQHRTDSVMSVIGKPLAFKELPREELPPSVLAAFPEATGAVWARVQFLMDTPEGKGAFERIRAGALSEWSFGYDAVQADYSPVRRKDGTVVNARNLRECRLYELSSVLFGMNPATATLSAKSAEPSEGKPWRAVRGDDGKWRVYKLDVDGQPTGDALGEHDTEEEAQAQCRALYASESGAGAGAPGSGGVTLAAREGAGETPEVEQPAEDKAGRVLARRNAERIQRALAELNDTLKDAGLLEPPDADDDSHAASSLRSSDAEKSAAVATLKAIGPNAAPPTSTEAGPDTEPPAYLSAVASLKMLELDLLSLEV